MYYLPLTLSRKKIRDYDLRPTLSGTREWSETFFFSFRGRYSNSGRHLLYTCVRPETGPSVSDRPRFCDPSRKWPSFSDQPWWTESRLTTIMPHGSACNTTGLFLFTCFGCCAAGCGACATDQGTLNPSDVWTVATTPFVPGEILTLLTPSQTRYIFVRWWPQNDQTCIWPPTESSATHDRVLFTFCILYEGCSL